MAPMDIPLHLTSPVGMWIGISVVSVLSVPTTLNG